MQQNIKVSAYCRVSTDKDEQINSLDSQRKYFKEYIEKNKDWTLVNIYYDDGISGTQTAKRTGFNQMIEDAFAGKIDFILTKEVSRFARNTVDTLLYTRKLKECGVGVLFTIDNINTLEPDGELRLTIMASIAQEESRKTSERVKWGQRRKMEQGVVFGRDLIGYHVNNGNLIINETEVAVIRAIFHKYTNEGKGTHIIARELIEEGMCPKRVKMWSNAVILRILKNEKYVGDLCQKKTITPNYLTHKKKYNHGEEAFVYLSNHHEAIIDRELWNRTQEELKKRSKTKEQKEKYSNRYWCSGKLQCGICGKRFVSRTKKYKDGNIYKAWRCYASAKYGRKKTDINGIEIGCENQSYNEQILLMAVTYAVLYLQATTNISFTNLKKTVLEELKKIQEKEILSKEMLQKQHDLYKHIEKQIEIYKEKKKKVFDLVLSEIMSEREAKEQKEWYNTKIDELEHQLLCLETQNIEKSQSREKYDSVLDKIMQFFLFDDTFKKSSDNFNCISQKLSQETVQKNSDSSNSILQDMSEEVFYETIQKNNDSSIILQDVPEQLYREIIEKIILYPKGIIHIFFRGCSFRIEMQVQTRGQRENYKIEVLEIFCKYE